MAPVRVGGHIKAPVKIQSVAPDYPTLAKSARVQGVVILECVISPNGTVADVKLLRGIPPLNEAVPVIMTVTVNFNLL